MDYNSLLKHFLTIRERVSELERQMSAPDIASDGRTLARLGREHSRLSALLPVLNEYESIVSQIDDDIRVIKENADSELVELAKEELETLQEKQTRLGEKLVEGLLPPDPNEGRDLIIEIRAGTGGEEAALFAGDLLRMYSRFAERQGWRFEIIDANPTNLGGYKEVIVSVKGDTAYSFLRFESGVHRVQRVPRTEASGRLHTSAASVVVLPEADTAEVEINENDIRIDTYGASGHGGQHVNRTYSAVRIVHLPTGIIATCQDEKSQHKNRDKAMRVLKARLLKRIQDEKDAELLDARRSQVRSGDRSDKIRTYNFPQNRITDHRIGYTAHNLTDVMGGYLDDLLDALRRAEAARALDELLTENSS